MYYSEIKQYRAPKSAQKSYLEEWLALREDFTGNLPLKRTRFSYENEMEYSALGWTIRYHDIAEVSKETNRREEVYVHEAIHTNDEYETRQISRWIVSKERQRYNFLKLREDVYYNERAGRRKASA